MSAPLVPSPLDYIGRRSFSFYPAIRDVEPNEWRLGTGSWSEVQVLNCHTGRELWVARQYVGGVSETGESYLIVGLTKELEFRAGGLCPRVRRVIEMPAESWEAPVFEKTRFRMGDIDRPSGPAHVIGIRLENVEDKQGTKAFAVVAIAAVVVSLLIALLSGMFSL